MGNLEELDFSDFKDDYNMSEDLDMFGGCLGIIDEGVGLFVFKFSNLRKVNLFGNYLILDNFVVFFSEKCSNLEEIVLKNCIFVI